MAQEPEQLERDIEQTRRDLGRDVDALADKVSPARVVERRVERTKNWFSNTKDKIMGSAPGVGSSSGTDRDSHTYIGSTYSEPGGLMSERDRGGMSSIGDTVGDATSTVSDKVGSAASSVTDTVSDAPQMLRERTEGNPLAAGLIAFGVGWLVSTLIPSTQVEQRAATEVREKAEPLTERAKDQLTETATHMKDELRPKAQEAAQSLKDSAASAASAVQDQARESGQQAADDARSAAQGGPTSTTTPH